MRIQWINHASFAVEHGDVRLASDPWLFGTAFDDGWALLSESPIKAENFDQFTHIWISHEHPDHFSPPTLRAIPAEARAKLTVLFQATDDGKVLEFCRELGFAEVVELQPNTWHNLAADFRVMCTPFPDDDSWLAIDTGDELLLNLNDCMVQTARQIESIHRAIDNRPISVLATQFSYANWVGNPGELEKHRAVAAGQLDRVRLQCQLLRPRYIIPFASFVRFCHEENAYLNDGMNTVRDTYDYLVEETTAAPVVLYPGDTWEVRDPHDPDSAMGRYDIDYARTRSGEGLLRSEPVPPGELKKLGDGFVAAITAHHGGAKLRGMRASGLLKPAHLWVSDHHLAVGLSVPEGLRRSSRERDNCDAELSSAALAYCLRHMWGGNTLLVNGRYRTLPAGNFEHFRRYLLLSDLVNHDKGIDGYVLPRARRLMDRVLEKSMLAVGGWTG